MKQKKISITIGIPAYNEEENIGHLIYDLLKQEQINFKIEKIIIASDGSTDKTIENIKRFKNKNILIIENKIRQGQASMQNQILRLCNSDAVVLLNADVILKDKLFLNKLVKPILDMRADLTSPARKELKPQNFFEEILYISTQIKKSIFKKVNSGNNLYVCNGTARALSKRLYKHISFKSSVGEDIYSYFFCIKNNFIYEHVKKTSIFYRLPNNLSDHFNQSIRFHSSKKILYDEFGKDFVNDKFNLPISLVLTKSIFFLKNFPLHGFMYALILLVIKIRTLFFVSFNDKWTISSSSKTLR